MLLLQFPLLVHPRKAVCQHLLFVGDRHVAGKSYRRGGYLFSYRIGYGNLFHFAVERMLHHID